MPLSGTSAIQVYHEALDSTLGCYINDPESGPFIILQAELDELTEKTVYEHLLAYHEKIPQDSPYKLFQSVVCFEDLVPPEAVPRPMSEIIIFARPARRWGYSAYLADDYRLIGRLG